MGLAPIWLRVAAAIGYDAMLELWRVLDSEPRLVSDSGSLEVKIRRYSAFLRWQRNAYAAALHASGRAVADIQEAVREQLGEDISRAHMTRIVTRR
jgi:hypothetical protein